MLNLPCLGPGNNIPLNIYSSELDFVKAWLTTMALKLSEGALYYSGGYVFSSIYRDYLHQQNNSCSDQNGSEAFSNRKSHDFFFFSFFLPS